MTNLKNKVAVITGGNSGIGYATAKKLSEDGVRVIITGRRKEAIEKMKNALLSFRISGIPSTIPFHLSALHDDRFLTGNYDTAFVEKLKSYSQKDGEIAALVFENMLKRRGSSDEYFKEDESKQDDEQSQQWILSRYEEFLKLQGNYNLENSMRWAKCS